MTFSKKSAAIPFALAVVQVIMITSFFKFYYTLFVVFIGENLNSRALIPMSCSRFRTEHVFTRPAESPIRTDLTGVKCTSEYTGTASC